MALKVHPNHQFVIIGGGIGGLSLGILLAKLDYPVTLIEQNKRVGGMMRSYTREGIECDTGIHYLGALGEGQVLKRCFDFLGVTDDIPFEKMGAEGIIDRYIFTNPKEGPDHFDLPEGFDAYAENLKTAFPSEIKAIDVFVRMLRRFAGQLNDLAFLYRDIPAVDLIDQMEPLNDLFNRLKCSPALRSVIGIPAYWLGIPAERCPLFFHNMTLANYLFSSWRLIRSGAHMADVFANRLRSLGGRIITGQKASQIGTKNGKVTHVGLENDEAFPAEAVISTIHPKLLPKLVGKDTLKPSYRNRIKHLKDTQGFCCVQAKIPATVRDPMSHNLFLINNKTKAGNDAMFIQLKRTANPNWHLLTLLGDGKTDLWRPWRKTWTGRRGRDYKERKAEVAEEMIAIATDDLGSLPGIKTIDVYTPLTIRDWVNSPNGSAYGIMKSSDQLLSAALFNRTAITGLYQAGQSALAPGILGTVLGSLATVKSILGPERFKKTVEI